jgi:glycosyltransferase involved in cell wall biosynthesis
MKSELDVTFVIPCLNEAETLRSVVDEIKAIDLSGRQFEILIADNGSTDGSQVIASESGCRVIDVPIRGYGSALRAGIEAAQGRIIVMGDADGSYRFSDSVEMIEKVESGEQIVVGNRFAGGIEKGAMPWLHRYLGNPVLSWLGRRLFSLKVRDFHCGLRAFNKEDVSGLNLLSTGMEFASEMLVTGALRSYKISEVSTILRPDGRSRAPHLRTWSDGWRHLRFLFAANPTYLLLYPSLLLGAFTFVVLCLAILGPVTILGVNFSQRTLVVISGLDILVVVSMWAFALSREIVAFRFGIHFSSFSPTRIANLRKASFGLFVIGLTTIVVQFLKWSNSGFGFVGNEVDLRFLILGTFLMTTGAISIVLGAVWVLLKETLDASG